ncbi:MAG: right-handed parallel beta-helix repeat-containing protein [Candidatus Kerfeldbacteria bacterium]|nr:right-handed parallel beta-helix repeat-containing protein [Candidatus Kerfeldbacteria bacterium]
MVLGIRALLVQERENLKRSEIRRENCFIYIRRWRKAFVLCELRKLFLAWVIILTNIFIFTVTLPVFFFMSVDKGFREVAARDWKGNFIESYVEFKRQRNLTLLVTAATFLTLTAWLIFSILYTLPRFSFGVGAKDICFSSSVQACVNAGYSKDLSFTTAQSAIDAATQDGQIVQVLSGAYHEAQIQLGSSQKNIILRGNVSDPTTTTLRGFWDNEGGLSDELCDGFQPASCEYHGSIIIVSGGNSSTIEGLYLYKGGDDSGSHWEGGGVRVSDASPTIQNNYVSYGYIRGSYTFGGRYNGGGISLTRSSARVQNNTISANQVYDYGGGIYVYGNNNTAYAPVIENNTIISNSSSKHLNNIERAGGGGIYVLQGKATIRGNSMTTNTAVYKGGGIRCQECLNGTLIEKNTVSGSTATYGAGIYIGGGANGKMVTVQNNVVYENAATTGVGGIHVENGNDVTILNNTIHGNTDGSATNAASLGLYGNPATAVVKNNIITGSTDRYGLTLGASVPTTNVDYNLLWNNALGAYGPGTSASTHDRSADPSFVSSASDDYHLRGDSTALNTGDAASAPATDLGGLARPSGKGVEPGAYEYEEALGNIYIDAFSGSDTSGHGTTAAPWKTITRALQTVRGGASEDILHLSSGTTQTAFTESVSLTSAHSGAANSPTQFVAWTDSGRTAPVINASANTTGISISGASFLTLSDITVSNAQDANIAIDSSSSITLDGVTVTHATSDGVRVSASSSVTVTNSIARENGDDGVSLTSNTTSSTISNSIFDTNSGNGIHLANTSSVALLSNSIYKSGGHGIQMSDASGNTLYNTVSSENGDYAIALDPFSEDRFTASNGNTFYSTNKKLGKVGSSGYATLAEWQAATGLDAQSLSQDPAFQNADDGDFTLLGTSVNIDAGVANVSPVNDILGNSRPQGNGVDIGAHETAFSKEAIFDVFYTDSATGSDTGTCSSAVTPCKTLTYTLSQMHIGQGQTLYARGTFPENVELNNPEFAEAGGASATSSPLTTTTITRWGETPFAVQGTPSGATLAVNTEYPMIFDGVTVSGGTRGVDIASANHDSALKNMVITDAQTDAIRVSGDDILLTNLTVLRNGTGVNLASGASTVTIQNTIFSENTTHISASSGAQYTSDYNAFDPESGNVGMMTDGTPTPLAVLADWQNATAQDAHSLAINPDLHNADGGDVHLKAASGARDAGTLVNAPRTDYEGHARPFDTSFVDIGADESRFPGTVSEVRATLRETEATLSWDAPYGTPTSYTLSYGTDEAGTNLGQQSQSAQSITLTSLIPATVYRFTITTTNTYGAGRVSDIFSFTTQTEGQEEEEEGDEEPEQSPVPEETPEPEEIDETASDLRTPSLVAPADWFTTENTRPIITGLAGSGMNVEIWIDGVNRGTTATRVHTSGVGDFSFTSPALLPGKHTVKARSVDGETTSVFSDEHFFFIFSKKEAKVLNTFERDYTNDPVNTTSSPTPTIVGLAPTAHMVEILVDHRVVATLTNRTTLNFAHILKAPLQLAIHSVFIREVNENGERIRESAPVYFRVIHPNPAPIILHPQAGEITSSTPIPAGVVKDHNLVNVFVDGHYVGTTTGREPRGGTSNFFFELTQTLSPGTHTIMTRAVDTTHPYKKESLNSNIVTITVP